MYTLHPFLRGRRRKCLGNSSEVRQNHGRIMAESSQNHRRIMEESWQNHGRIMADSWKNHNRLMAELWKNHGRLMAEAWQNHGPHSMQRLIIGIPTRPSPQAYRVHQALSTGLQSALSPLHRPTECNRPSPQAYRVHGLILTQQLDINHPNNYQGQECRRMQNVYVQLIFFQVYAKK